MSRGLQNSRGFSLIEVLAALFILGVAAVAVIGLFSISLKGVRKTENTTLATAHARSLLEHALASPDVAAAGGRTELDGSFSGTTTVVQLSTQGNIALFEITATVQWPPSGQVTLSATRAVNIAAQ